jgi:hypothetical protein
MAAVGLLTGSACTVVHSDRPMGSVPYVSWPTPDSGRPGDLNGFWALTGPVPAGSGAQFLVAVHDPTTGRYRIGYPVNGGLYSENTARTEVELRAYVDPARPEDPVIWLFFSEEDQATPGTYLWALARQYDADTFVLWYTDGRAEAFEAMVSRGELPGIVVPHGEARSGIVPGLRRRVVLRGVDDAVLKTIIEHRFELFALDQPVLLTRFRRLPTRSVDDLLRLDPPASAASAAVR